MNIATMKRLEQLYKRISTPIEQVIFPVILLLWPLLKVNQGVDVTDSTYSLGNYLFADRLDGVWIWSTYVSNGLGSILVRLPGGDTLLGMNIYTGLLISATALMCYYALRREFTAPVMFVGEFLSIGLCWIPSTILYNYLTYFLFNLAAVLIYHAVKKGKSSLFCAAGVALGLNVFVRIPNLAEMGLIIAVWTGVGISLKTKTVQKSENVTVVKATLMCIGGYIVGILIPVIALNISRGQDVFARLTFGLGEMSSSNDEYTVLSMIGRTAGAYAHSAKWFGIILAVIFAGTLMIAAVKSRFVLKWIGRTVYTVVLIVMFRFFWGRGMFSFRYYEDYTSVYEWAMIILFVAWICMAFVFLRPGYNVLVRTMAAIVFAILVITPLGSNNYTMQNINNMFLVLPFVLYITGGWLYKGMHRIRLQNLLEGCNYPWMSMLIAVFSFFAIQTSGFHMGFVFCDGMDGSPRDHVIERSEATESISGMRTTEENGRPLTDICEYIHNDTNVSSIIYWGDCPGMSYILRIPPAISTIWPDLDSYPTERFKSDLNAVQVDNEKVNKDNTVILWRKYTDYSAVNVVNKEAVLKNYIKDNGMSSIYENEEYVIYR